MRCFSQRCLVVLATSINLGACPTTLKGPEIGVAARPPTKSATPKKAPAKTPATIRSAPLTRASRAMLEARAKAASLLRLPDARFTGCDDECTLKLQTKLGELCTQKTHTPPQTPISLLAIGAPRQVQLDAGAIPLLIAHRHTGQRQWEVDARQNVKVIAVDLASGALYVHNPLRYGKRRRRYRTPRPSMSGPPPDDINARSTMTGVKYVELKQDMGLPRQPTRLALTSFSYDWASNTAVVELKSKTKNHAKKDAPTEPSPFLLQAETQSIAQRAGPKATLSIPATVASEATIEVGITLDLPARHLVMSKTSAGTPLVSVALVMFKKDAPSPPIIPITAPAAYHQPKSSTERWVKASFRLALRKALSTRTLLGVYQVFLIAGEKTHGPYAMSVSGDKNDGATRRGPGRIAIQPSNFTMRPLDLLDQATTALLF